MSINGNTNIIMNAGVIYKEKDLYRFRGGTGQNQCDWRVAEQFNVMPIEAENTYNALEELVIKDPKAATEYILSLKLDEELEKFLIKSVEEFKDLESWQKSIEYRISIPDYDHYAMQLVLGTFAINNAGLSPTTRTANLAIAVSKGTWLEKIGWSLSYYNNCLNFGEIYHSILRGSVEFKITEGKDILTISGNLKTDNRYYYFLDQVDQMLPTPKGVKYFLTPTAGYTFDLIADRVDEFIFKMQGPVKLFRY